MWSDMASISKVGSRYRGSVCVNRKRKSKTFRTETEAIKWASKTEKDIQCHDDRNAGELQVTKQEELYSHLKAGRNERGVTQRELGEKLGVTPQAIGQWEKPVSDGGVVIPIPRIKEIEDVLGLDFGEIELVGSNQRLNTNFIKSKPEHKTHFERRIAIIEKVVDVSEETLSVLEALLLKK